MFVYVEWKIDLAKPNKVNIIRITQEKDPTLKYNMSKSKYVLSNIVLKKNFNSEQVFFTRVNVGNIKNSNLNILRYESINKFNDTPTIKVYLSGCTNVLSVEIKSIHNENIFNIDFEYYSNDQTHSDFDNYPVLNDKEKSSELNNFVKDLKKNKTQTKTNKYHKPYTLFLDTIQLDELEKLEK